MQAKKLSSVRKEESASLLHNVQYSKLLFRCFPQNAYLFTYLFVHLFTCSLHAQIGIGSADNPLTGTILDLSCGAVGGLMLSNVSIEHPAEIPDDFPGVSGADETVVKADLTGSIVYNTNENTCVGVHVWDGNRWVQLASNISRKSSGEPLSIISDVTNLLENDTVKFAVATTAKICTWYVNSDNAGYKYLATTTMPSFSGVFPDGSHKVKVILNNCHFLEESNEVSFAPGRISPHFGSTAGGNYIYVYGDFPYVAIDDYTQSGLVAHYDGINNTGQGDKYHSNNNGTGWTNLATKQTINRNNFTPNADGGWKTNGWKVTNNAGFWSETIPSGIPTGAASNTIEIIYTTPDNGISVNSNARKGLFGYGNLMVEADRTRRAFQYDRNSLYAPDNWSCNVEYTQKDYPDLFAGNKLISLAVSYKGGVALSSSNASIAYFSGVKATPSNVNNCIPDIASAGQFYLGGYDPAKVQGYASVPAWTVHSLRIYNRVLSEAEVAHNSSLDRIRYLNPPSVTVGGNACTEVVVLSPKTLICKVPVGTEGVVDVVIDNVSLPGVYQYVDATSAFYVSSITPIIGPAAGTTLTLTGNKLNEISEIKAGDAVCTNLAVSGDQKSCTVTLPAHPEGEVDIIVITTDGKRYRFAKIFEYKG